MNHIKFTDLAAKMQNRGNGNKQGDKELIKKIFDKAEKTENEHCFLTAFAVSAAVFLIAMMMGNSLGAVITASAAEGGSEKESAQNAGGTETETVTATETRTISIHEIITYDIWKHINGVWQFGKAWLTGSYV